jgi:hypothetical protein
MTVNIGDVVKAVSEFVFTDGTIGQNVFYYELAGENAQDDDDVKTAIVTAIDDLYTLIDDCISDEIVLNPMAFTIIGWSVEQMKWVTEANLGYETPAWAGANIADPFPNQIAAVLTAATARPKARGRKFFPMFAENQAIAGDLIGGALTALAAAGALWLQNLPLGGLDGLWPIVPSTLDGAKLGLQSVEVNSILGTYRKRKPGVGI